MDSTDSDSFLQFTSPHINGDDESMQLFDGLDVDPLSEMIRQPISPTFSYVFGSLPKSHDFENNSLTGNGNRLSPGSSLRDSVSTSSNDQEHDGNAPVKVENVKQETANGYVFGANNTMMLPQHQINTMISASSEIEDSNRAMESHFDFDSAGTTPDSDVMDIGHLHRHVAIPAALSPSQASLASPSIEDIKPVAHPISNMVPRDMNQNIYNRMPMNFGYSHPTTVAPHSLPFGYQFDGRTPAVATSIANNHLMKEIRPRLWIDTPKATSRVEIQIIIKLALYPFPPSIKKVHLQPYTISRPKFLAKPTHQPSPDTLELYATLVCASAITDAEKYKSALQMAAQSQRDRKKPAARQALKGKQAEKKSPDDVLHGDEVWICEGCINRERKRNDRKKSKKAEDEEAWKEYEEERIIVFNTNEIKDWEPFQSPRGKDEQRQYPPPEDPPQGSMQVDLPMRIACYCRHHDEKQGFRVIFTLKTHLGELIAQNITPPINITDDHKTVTKEGLHASMWNNQIPPLDFNQEAILETVGPIRNSLSTADLQGLQKALSQPSQANGFTAPFANPQNYNQHSQVSPISRGVSRQASPSYSRPASKKRKSVSNSTRLPESLKMTRLQPGALQTNGGSTSYPASPVHTASPMSATMRPDQSFIDPQPAHNYASPDSNGFGSVHRSSRSLSYENLSNLQGMYSAPPSVLHSRAPSPGSIGPHLTEFGGHQFPQQVSAHMLGQQNDMTQPRPLPIIHKVIPRQGSKAGGYDVTIVGTGFYNGLSVRFGDALASTTTYWGPSTLVCLVPPARCAGKVPVTVHDSMVQYGTTNLSNKILKFEYVDDEEMELLRRAVVLIGHRDTGRPEDAASIARRIIGSSASGSTSRDGGATNGTYRHANGTMDSSPAEFDYEAAVLKCLDLVDMSDSPHPPRYDLKGMNGQTILHVACSLGYYRLVAALLARGANPNARDRNGMTPMHVAALNDHLPIVRKLKHAGGDPHVRSVAGWTPAHMATSTATRFAAMDLTSFNSNRSTPPSTVSHSTSSSISFHSRQARHTSHDYNDEYDEEYDEDLTDSEDESDGTDGEDTGIYQQSGNHSTTAIAKWAASRRNSAADNLSAAAPSQLDIANHRYMQFVTAWRDQFAAQWQQFQQNFGLPPITLADYQNQTNLMARGFEALRGSLPTASIDSKERLQQTENQHWWDYFTGNNSPPSYDEIYPATNSARDTKIESAARAALDTEADAKSSALYDTRSASLPASTSSITANSSAAATTTATNDSILLQQQSKTPKRLRSDRKLFLVWIPLLVLLLVAMLKDRVPEMITLVQRGMNYATGSKEVPFVRHPADVRAFEEVA